MREIQASMITDTIERLCIEANQVLPDDIKNPFRPVVPVRTDRLPVASLTTLSKITKLPRTNRFRSARIPEWPAFSLKSDRTYILQEEI